MSDESLCISINDTLDKLKAMQFNDIPITVDYKKLKWCGSLESLKIFVNTTLNMKGKWSSPGGYLKLFNETSKGIVIRYYSDTASLLFQEPEGKQIGDVLIDKLTNKCENSEGTDELQSLQSAMTNVSLIQSNDQDNIPISVDSSCQTMDETAEMRFVNSKHNCSCLCGDAVKEINGLKSKIEDLQSVVCSLESVLKDQETILSLYNRAASLNEKYIKEINDFNQCISGLKENIVKLEQERDSLQLAVRLISQDKLCSAPVNQSNQWHCPIRGNTLKVNVDNNPPNAMNKESNNRFKLLPDECEMSISNRAEPNYANSASFDSNSVINVKNSDTEQPNTYSDKLRKNK